VKVHDFGTGTFDPLGNRAGDAPPTITSNHMNNHTGCPKVVGNKRISSRPLAWYQQVDVVSGADNFPAEFRNCPNDARRRTQSV